MLGRDQHLALAEHQPGHVIGDQHPVIGADQHVTVRHVLAQRAAADQHRRQHRRLLERAARQNLLPRPAQLANAVVAGDHLVARAQILDRAAPFGGCDPGARREADHPLDFREFQNMGDVACIVDVLHPARFRPGIDDVLERVIHPQHIDIRAIRILAADDNVIAGTLQRKEIGLRAALHRVIARPAGDRILARAAQDRVIAGAARQAVIAPLAQHQVRTAAAEDRVVALLERRHDRVVNEITAEAEARLRAARLKRELDELAVLERGREPGILIARAVLLGACRGDRAAAL